MNADEIEHIYQVVDTIMAECVSNDRTERLTILGDAIRISIMSYFNYDDWLDIADSHSATLKSAIQRSLNVAASHSATLKSVIQTSLGDED
jgi:hypothetical protein